MIDQNALKGVKIAQTPLKSYFAGDYVGLSLNPR